MIRRSAVVYIIVLLALASVIYYLNTRESITIPEATAKPTGEVSYLFSTEDGVPVSIVIEAAAGGSVGVARNQESAWMVILPVEAQAEQGASEAAASQVTSMRILERSSQIQPEAVGLQEPEYFLTVRFNTGTERKVHIGVVTPTESGYYVQDETGGEVLIVSKSAVDSLLRMLSSPPYADSPATSLP